MESNPDHRVPGFDIVKLEDRLAWLKAHPEERKQFDDLCTYGTGARLRGEKVDDNTRSKG